MRDRSYKSLALCLSRLSTTPTADYVLSAHVHKLLYSGQLAHGVSALESSRSTLHPLRCLLALFTFKTVYNHFFQKFEYLCRVDILISTKCVHSTKKEAQNTRTLYESTITTPCKAYFSFKSVHPGHRKGECNKEWSQYTRRQSSLCYLHRL